jgi:pyruvate/2-oxoglutarate dehydrogenase complex dihydrolipoamide dehydrogenase (E3) component
MTETDLIVGKPDAVILATGARPMVPPLPGSDGPSVRDARDVLLGRVAPRGPAVILGAGYVGMETADYLLARDVAVTLLEMQAFPPVGKHTAHGYWLHKRLKEKGAQILLGATVTGITADTVSYRAGEEEKRIPAVLVVTALGAGSENSLEESLQTLGMAYRTVGDAKSPRRLLEAIHEGHRAGREIF